MSWADDEDIRRQPNDYELAELAEYRAKEGIPFRPDLSYEIAAPTRLPPTSASDGDVEVHYYADSGTRNSDARDALTPILKARLLSKCRVLDVVCSNSHRLAQVVRTPRGPVVTGVGPRRFVEIEHVGGEQIADADGRWVTSDWQYDWQRNRLKNRDHQVYIFLEKLGPHRRLNVGMAAVEHVEHGETYNSVIVQCRCRTAHISGEWLAGHIDAGRRRVVHE